MCGMETIDVEILKKVVRSVTPVCKHFTLPEVIKLFSCSTYTVKFIIFRRQKLCCILPKIQTKRPNLMVFCQNDVNGIAN